MSDDDTTPLRSHQTPPHGTDCVQERRLRVLERKVEAHDGRLGEGTRTMDRLTMSVEALTKSVDALNAKMLETQKPSPWVTKTIDAAITMIVPAAILMVIWLAVQSGVVPVKAPAIPEPAKDAPK
ncbi:hypothetical protein UFOVP141_5 [uncultured Caudovirales phage]|uniref:Uncharacterized protein n=1 Tax=uncultured Caudovirales phage TaxID=2100421 RepID=A0A6J7VKH7_9CAUD|nr:hypothetical protein UFOVP141_5 [uncultured Caudovirales phage]